MLRWMGLVSSLALPLLLAGPVPVESACCYFSAKNKDVLQPAQKAFITWNPEEKVESFTVQPKFEGNALDFGMVIPTPGRPKLDEMPHREFFKELAVFTILEPMDLSKYKSIQPKFDSSTRTRDPQKPAVRVLEAGVVGSLDYKIIQADRADDLFAWLKASQYHYAGDEASLDFYLRKNWYFTVMKIDPMQMKKKPDGGYEGEVTPTRFTFATEKLIYPLRITQISVRDKTEALFYIEAPHKVDLTGELSYQFTFAPMWNQATSFAIEDKLSEGERNWQKHLQSRVMELSRQGQQLRQKGREPATLEWAKRLTETDLAVLDGSKPFNREAPREDVERLKILKGHLQKGQFITKMRKVFTKAEMNADLEFVPARVGDQADRLEYSSILPTSPP